MSCVVCGKKTKNMYCSNACSQRAYRMRKSKKPSTVTLNYRDKGKLITELAKYQSSFATSGNPEGIHPSRWNDIVKGNVYYITFEEFKLIGKFYTNAIIELLDLPIREVL